MGSNHLLAGPGFLYLRISFTVIVSVTEKIRCTILHLCPLHYNAVMGILHEIIIKMQCIDCIPSLFQSDSNSFVM